MTVAQLRLFLSSPADVADERRRVETVVQRLNTEFIGRVRVGVFRWEDAFYSATLSFQEAIDQAVSKMRAVDMVVCIVWKRVGTPLNPEKWRRTDGTPYESGTVLEVENAVEVSRHNNGAPDVYLFRKNVPILYAATAYESEALQHKLLNTVWTRWTETPVGHNIAGSQSFSTPDDFAEKLEACLRQWLARKGFVAEGPIWDRLKGPPFPGLAPFDGDRQTIFFGRDLAIAHAVTRLREAGDRRCPFLLVVGPSGAGKSSLLRAGLVPRLTLPGSIPDVESWRRAVMIPGEDPIASLADVLLANEALGEELRRARFRDREDLIVQLCHPDPIPAIKPLCDALEAIAEARQREQQYETPRPSRLVLAVDQAERLFVESSADRRRAFANLVASMVRQSLAFVIMVLRSDTYAAFQTEPALVALRDQGATFDLGPPTHDELQEMVARPVAACRPPLAFEERDGVSLDAQLVGDIKGGDALPLLQVTLSRLYGAEAARNDGVLRFEDYHGIGAAVMAAVEEVMAELTPEARLEVPALVTSLVRDIAEDPVTGAMVPVVAPLSRHEFERGDTARQHLVDAFVTHRLLTSEGDGRASVIRPVHDSLLRIWPEAIKNVSEMSALIKVRRTLEPIVKNWQEASADLKGRHLEISPALLEGARELEKHFGGDLPGAVLRFIAKAGATHEARVNAERRRERRLLAVSLATLVVFAGLGAVAATQWGRADAQAKLAGQQRDRAEVALLVARSQQEMTAGRLWTALDLAAQAFVREPSDDTRSAYLAPLMVVSPYLEGRLDTAPELTDALVWTDERTLAYATSNGFVRTVERRSEQLTSRPSGAYSVSVRDANGYTPPVVAMQAVAGGQFVALIEDGHVAALDLSNGRVRIVEPPTSFRINLAPHSASISADGHLIAFATIDAGAHLFLCEATGTTRPLKCANQQLTSAFANAVSIRRGDNLIAVGTESSVEFFSPSGSPLFRPLVTGFPVRSLAWHPTHAWLAVGGDKGRLTVYDLDRTAKETRDGGAAPLGTVPAGSGLVASIQWSESGNQLTFVCDERTICIAPVKPDGSVDGREIVRLAGHQNEVTRLAWSPDGKHLASVDAGGDISRDLLFWGTEPDRRVAYDLKILPSARATAIEYAPDAGLLAAAREDGEVSLWDRTALAPDRSGQPIAEARRLTGAPVRASALAWGSGGTLAVGYDDAQIAVFRRPFYTAERRTSLNAGPRRLLFEKDSDRLIALADDDQLYRIRLPQEAAGEPKADPFLDGGGVRAIALHPDRRTLYVSRNEGAIEGIDLQTGRTAKTLPSPGTVAALSLSIHPNGRLLAATGGDQFVKIFDLQSATLHERLPMRKETGSAVAFNSDGRLLAAIGSDGRVYVWRVEARSAERFLVFEATSWRNGGGSSIHQYPQSLAWVAGDELAILTADGGVRVVNLDSTGWVERLAELSPNTVAVTDR